MRENSAEVMKLVQENDVPISELDLSARAYNLLKLNGIRYLSNFVAMDLEDLKKLDLISPNVAEELFMCAWEHLYNLRKSGIAGKKTLSNVEQSDALISEEEKRGYLVESSAPEKGATQAHEERSVDPEVCDEKDSELTLENLEKTELDDDRPIEVLELSVRAYNCLKRARIDTIRQLSKMTFEELSNVKNMGRKTVEEIEGKINALMTEKPVFRDGSDKNDSLLNTSDIKPIQELGLSSLNTNSLLSARIRTVQALVDCPDEAFARIPNLSTKAKQEIMDAVRKYREATEGLSEEGVIPETARSSDDRPLEELNLSVRSFNCLKRAKITTVQQLLDTTSEDLLNIRNLGRKSLDEIEAFKRSYSPPVKVPAKTQFSVEELKPLVLGAFVKPFKGLSFQEIKGVLPSTAGDQNIKKAIGSLISEKDLEYVDYRCYKVYPSFYSYFESNLEKLDERTREILTSRYAGETLEAIAQRVGITRERVRQIYKKSNGRFMRTIRLACKADTGSSYFDEDFYEPLYTSAELPDEFWTHEIGLSKPSLDYLNAAYSRGKARPDEILSEEKIPISLRYRVRSFLDCKKVRIDGQLLPPRRAEIEDYAIRKFAQDELLFDHFIELYNGLLENNRIPFDEKLYYTDDIRRTRSNRFAESMVCLWKQGERFRFYDIQAHDYTELLETLNLGSYQNTEVSTRKFMALHPDLMEKYDIRDPYELHNLLKKIAGQYGLDGVQFSRQPMLQFGTFDRDKAIWDALVLLSPVTQADLCDYLYQEYGYERLTTAINYLKPLSQYCHNGVYSVDYQHIPEWRIEPLQNALTADFYYVDEIKEVYISLFRDADENDINPRSLKSLGFLVNNTYVIQGYSSADAFFRNLLTRDDVYSAREYISRFGSIQMFNQVYAELLHTHVIFKYEQDQIITLSRLERFGISAEIIEDYCAAVQDYLDADCYFTIESLRQDGFTHQLDSLGFSDFFYASLLGVDKRFSVQRAFGTPVLYNGMVSGQFSVADFIVSQLRDYDSVDLDEFIQDIQDRFGIKIPERYEVTYAIKGTELYYDDIMDKVYLDKALYYADFDE